MDLIALGILPPDSVDTGHFAMPVERSDDGSSSSDASIKAATAATYKVATGATHALSVHNSSCCGTAAGIANSCGSDASGGAVVNPHMLKSHAPAMPAPGSRPSSLTKAESSIATTTAVLNTRHSGEALV